VFNEVYILFHFNITCCVLSFIYSVFLLYRKPIYNWQSFAVCETESSSRDWKRNSPSG